MIVKISSSGVSFKGISQYLTHDQGANTSDRVAWTHTHNLAADNGDIPLAINEMYLTAENAELLKQEAGIRAGGRSTEKAVKHISLNWAPADNPSQDHMIKSSKHFLDSMGWGEHQAIFVAHSDKAHKHVHMVLNAIHPGTGRHLNESWENNRAQRWAAEYERAQDCIRCPQRGLEYAEREMAMPRNMWTAFQQNETSFVRGEELLRKNSENEFREIGDLRNSEWKILKEMQSDERKQFFADGKTQFSELRKSIYREVKEEFSERWKAYYQAEREGAHPKILQGIKEEIIKDRNAVFEPRRDAACLELRGNRDAEYREILELQRDQRQTLKWHQGLGLETSDFFHELNQRREANVVTEDFRRSALEVTQHGSPPDANDRAGREFSEAATEVGIRPLSGITSFGVSMVDSFFTTLTNLGSARPEPMTNADREEATRLAAEGATGQREQAERDRDDEDWRKRSKELHGRE
jgi:hypothetical protein